MKNAKDLDLNYYLGLAAAKVGYKGKLQFQTMSRWGEAAGDFEILDFKPYPDAQFTFTFWKAKQDQTPDGAKLGTYTIKLSNSKFYSGRIFECYVSAYVQNDDGLNDQLYVDNQDVNTKKRMKAYEFPILNWN
jgi:hypothetical protein